MVEAQLTDGGAMRRIAYLIGACAVAFGGSLAVFGMTPMAQAGKPTATAVDPSSDGGPVVVATIPSDARTSLTAEEREQARGAAVESPVAAGVFGEVPFAVHEIAMWSDDFGEPLGAVVRLRPERPISLRRGLPVFSPAPRSADGHAQARPSARPYETEPAPFTAQGVREIRLYVDLRQNPSVVALRPDPAAQIDWDDAYLRQRGDNGHGGE